MQDKKNIDNGAKVRYNVFRYSIANIPKTKENEK